MFAGVREVELDEDDAEETFELEEVDKVEQLQVALVDALSIQVTRSVYLTTDVAGELTILMMKET